MLGELRGYGGQAVIEFWAKLPHTGLGGVSAGEERRARRRTQRLIGDALPETDAAFCQGINVRCDHGWILVVGADKVCAKLVGADHQDIGSESRRRG